MDVAQTLQESLRDQAIRDKMHEIGAERTRLVGEYEREIRRLNREADRELTKLYHALTLSARNADISEREAKAEALRAARLLGAPKRRRPTLTPEQRREKYETDLAETDAAVARAHSLFKRERTGKR